MHTLAALLMGVVAAGCAKQPAVVTSAQPMAPAGAKLLAFGQPPLSAVIADGGTVSIYDVTTQELKHTLSNLPAHETVMITIDPATKSIVAAPPTTQPGSDQAGEGEHQKFVLLHPINPTDRYAIYVERPDDDDGDEDEEDDD